MYVKLVSVSLSVLLLSACQPRPSYQSISLQPDIRQPIYTHEIGRRRGLVCNAVDLNPPPYFPFDDLPGDSAQIGYVSSDNGSGQRRLCRRDRNTEFHALLTFDLNEVLASVPTGVLYKVTLSGAENIHTDNEACELTRNTLIDSIVLDWSPLPAGTTVDPTLALEVAPVDVDGEALSLRERAALRGEMFTQDRVGSDPNFVYPWTIDSLNQLNIRINNIATTGIGTYNVLVLGKENPEWTSDRSCLANIDNLRLNLIFRRD